MRITVRTEGILIARKVPPELKKRLPTREELWELAKLQYTPEKAEKIIRNHNTITHAGYHYFASAIGNTADTFEPMQYIAYGNSGKEPSVNDTGLYGDITHYCDEMHPYYEGSYTVDFVGYIAYGNGNDLTIREAGIWEYLPSDVTARWIFPGGWTKTAEHDACIIWKLRIK